MAAIAFPLEPNTDARLVSGERSLGIYYIYSLALDSQHRGGLARVRAVFFGDSEPVRLWVRSPMSAASLEASFCRHPPPNCSLMTTSKMRCMLKDSPCSLCGRRSRSWEGSARRLAGDYGVAYCVWWLWPKSSTWPHTFSQVREIVRCLFTSELFPPHLAASELLSMCSCEYNINHFKF